MWVRLQRGHIGYRLNRTWPWTREGDSRITVERQDNRNDDKAMFKEGDEAKEKPFREKMIKALEFEV